MILPSSALDCMQRSHIHRPRPPGKRASTSRHAASSERTTAAARRAGAVQLERCPLCRTPTGPALDASVLDLERARLTADQQLAALPAAPPQPPRAPLPRSPPRPAAL